MAFGLRPSKKVGSGCNSKGVEKQPVANSYGSAIYRGDPVKLSAGTIVLAGNGDKVLGVMLGANYTDTAGNPVAGSYLPASTAVATGDVPYDSWNGASQPTVKVLTDPTATYWIEADSSITAGQLGLNARVSGIGTGTTHSGDSSAILKVVSITASGGDATSADAQTMVRIIGVAEIPGNSIGAASPILEVKFNYHEHYLTNA